MALLHVLRREAIRGRSIWAKRALSPAGLKGALCVKQTMPILKRRSRPITFRVSGEEYDTFTKACTIAGARSVSDFARAAVLYKVQSLGVESRTLTGDLTTLSAALGDLDTSLRDLSKRIRAVLGDVPEGKRE